MHYSFAPIISHLAHTATSIVDKETVEAAGDSYGSKPVGTGPYVLVEWNIGDNILLEANEDYWGEPAKQKISTLKTSLNRKQQCLSLNQAVLISFTI